MATQEYNQDSSRTHSGDSSEQRLSTDYSDSEREMNKPYEGEEDLNVRLNPLGGLALNEQPGDPNYHPRQPVEAYSQQQQHTQDHSNLIDLSSMPDKEDSTPTGDNRTVEEMPGALGRSTRTKVKLD